jgi:hypothetical protein
MINYATLQNAAFNFSKIQIKDLNNSSLLNSWKNYDFTAGGVFARAGWFLDALGFVKFSGLIKDGAGGSQMAALPLHLAPYFNQLFASIKYTAGTEDGLGRVDVNNNSTLYSTTTSNIFTSLESIYYPTFVSGWRDVVYANSWDSLDVTDTWGGIKYYKDVLGMVHLMGLTKNPTTNKNGMVVFNLPAGFRPDVGYEFPVLAVAPGEVCGQVTVETNGDVRLYCGNAAVSYASLSGISFMAADSQFVNDWKDLALVNGWVAGTPKPQYLLTPDGYLTLRGTIQSGTTTLGTLIATVPDDGSRPAGGAHLCIANSPSGFASVRLDTNGQITARVVNATWTKLDGIRLRAQTGLLWT